MGRELVYYVSIPNIKHIYGFTSAWIRRLGWPRKLGHSNAYGFPRAMVEFYIETHQVELFNSIHPDRCRDSRIDRIARLVVRRRRWPLIVGIRQLSFPATNLKTR